MCYFYKVYGLTIQSEILIPELSILDDYDNKYIDVKIGYKEMNTEIKESINKGKIADYKRDDMWFYIENVATYHIYNGNTVDIEPCKDTDFQKLKIYILGSVLGMILLQRNIVAIHGSGIIINNNGYIITGKRGAGKSTLTTALRQRGYKFISDDVCAIKDGMINMIRPGFGYQKLCKDTMVKFGHDTSKFKTFRSDYIIKYSVPVLDAFVSYDIPFKVVFEICVEDIEEVRIDEVLGVDKLDRLIENIFRIEILKNAGGMSGAYLKKCVDIAKSIKYYKITRPKGIFSIEEQINEIESVVFNNKQIVKS